MIQNFLRKIVIGYEGKFPEGDLVELIGCIKPFGIIFFSRNFTSPAELKNIIAAFRDVNSGLEFLIDQEGGEKCRIFGKPYCPPEPWSMRDLPPVEIRRHFRDSAEALAELGITINLAPVADLGTGDYIRRRTFGTDPQAVAERVLAAVEGITAGGLTPCVKHFPGLGAAQFDPHKTLPISNIPLEEYIEKHWVPFAAAISAGVPYIMTTHIIATAIDRKNPATYSSLILNELEKLGFSGQVFSDDLAEMKGAHIFSPQERIKKAFSAGHDVVLWCNISDFPLESIIPSVY